MAAQGETSDGRFLRSIIIIGIGMTFVVIAGAAAFLALQDDNTEDFVILKADTNPIRQKPVEQGGAVIDHQDSAVLQMLDEIKEPNGESDRLILPDANPELPPVSLPEDELKLAEDNNPIAQIIPAEETNSIESAGNSISEEQSPDSVEPLSNDTIAEILNENKADKRITNSLSADSEDGNTNSGLSLPKSRPNTSETATNQSGDESGPKIITEPESFNEDNPPLMVQLAAFRDQIKAEQAAAILTEKHSERLLSLQLGIMSIDTGSSGIFWRVITEPLPSVDARMICDALKLAGQDCILRPVSISGL